MKTIEVSGLNVYNPTPEQLLDMMTAVAVKWKGRGLGKIFVKRSISGPHLFENNKDVVYHVAVGNEMGNPRLTELYQIN